MRVIDDPAQKSIQLRIYGYLRSRSRRDSKPETGAIEFSPGSAGQLEKDVFEAFHGKTALIFINAKSDIEKIADFAQRESERLGIPSPFRVHHGSLSKAEREDTEEALKSANPTTTFCSSTLEMGIDVGNVKVVGQIGPPWSVSSLTQRLGRSGRKKASPQSFVSTSKRTNPKKTPRCSADFSSACFRRRP